jgi:Tfp pilus assembly protein PilF
MAQPVSAACSATWRRALCLVVLFAPGAVLAQGQQRRPPPPEATVLEPAAAAGSAASRLKPWVARIAAAEGDLKKGRREKARQVFEELLEADRRNPIARRYLAEIHLAEGRWDEARALAERAARRPNERRDAVPLIGWHLLAPFPYKGDKGFDEVYGPEADPAAIDLKASHAGDGRICRWLKVKGARIDFREALDVSGAAVGYGYCELTSRRDGWVRLGISSADGIKVWLNGELILERHAHRRIQEDDDLLHVLLQRGKNVLLVKVDSDGGAFRFYLQAYEELPSFSSEFLDAAIAGREALKRRNYAEAERRFLEAELLEGSNPEVALGLAEAALCRGNPIAARAWTSRALLERPGSASGLAIHAETLLQLGEPLKAFEAFRAAYRAGGCADERILGLWVAAAKARASPLHEGLALLEEARGRRLAKDAEGAAKLLEASRPLLETSFVGLAELSDYQREAGDRKSAAELGWRAVEKLTAQQIVLNCSADWLVALARELRETQPENAAARETVLAHARAIDAEHRELAKELAASARGAAARGARGPAVSPQVEELLRAKPDKELYKQYVERLFQAKEYEKVVEISRQGLATGVVSRKLLYWQGHALLALGRLDESETAFRKLLAESDYAERAREGLALVTKARGAGE